MILCDFEMTQFYIPRQKLLRIVKFLFFFGYMSTPKKQLYIFTMINYVIMNVFSKYEVVSLVWTPFSCQKKCVQKVTKKYETSILTAVKEGLQSYHNICYSRSGNNSVWILKIRKIFWKPSIQDYQNKMAFKLIIFQLFTFLFQ